MHVEIKFPGKTEFDSKGRNGYVTTTGVEVATVGDDIHLSPINSRGAVAESARVSISRDAATITSLILALEEIRETIPRPGRSELP